jgi:hypothetical protein
MFSPSLSLTAEGQWTVQNCMKRSFVTHSLVLRPLSTCLCVLSATIALSQGQTTGRIAGTVKDVQSGVIHGAEVSVENSATGDKRTATTNDTGTYAVPLVPPDSYVVTITARGFVAARFNNVEVIPGGTTEVNASLALARTTTEVTVDDVPPLIRTDSPEIGVALEGRAVSGLPLPTRNFMQLVALAPGVSMPLTNNSAIGRNSPNFSVNGARVSQNSFRLNGLDASDISFHESFAVAVPAPESIREVRLGTSLCDASAGRAGGGSVEVVTQSGTNALHGSLYEYFRNDVFNANDPNLNERGLGRPVLRRNVYGATTGGAIRKNNAFFFFSYQGTRETNGATSQSLYKDVLIARGLTDDRSEATLLETFHPKLSDDTPASSIDPAALALLNTKLPNGQWLIPTPQQDGRVSGTAISTYHEEQFNSNFDFHLGSKDMLAAKLFFANAPQFGALGGANLPGFGTVQHINNRLLSVQEVHTFSPNTVNEARFGYDFIRTQEVTQEPIHDSDLGIHRPTADLFPGLPLILLARDQDDGAQIGSGGPLETISPTLSLTNILSLARGRHSLRVGAEFRAMEWSGRADFFYGAIAFAKFNDFLTGSTDESGLSSGISQARMRSTDYNFFVQDDWRVGPRFTLNFGLRYELDLPPYDTKGRFAGFEPGLYRPRLETADGLPVGPPIGGIVQAGNPIPQYDTPEVPNVGKRLVKSLDPNNLGPRFGFAWSPLDSGRLALRGGYGIFYSRPAFVSLGLDFFTPPFFFDSVSNGQPFENPFPDALREERFPLIQPGILLSGTMLDRNNRTPYFQQFNASLQYEPVKNLSLQVAYVGTRGLKLFRQVAFNQARIASLRYPIVNEVTGEVITANTADNAALRAPFQGALTGGALTFNQSSGQSTYHSLQATLTKRLSSGLQFLASYTFSKSIDDASGPGGGAGSDGTVDIGGGLDTSWIIGHQFDGRANRGISDFDRTHRFVASAIWDMPTPGFARHSKAGRGFLANWQVSEILIAMSGLPVDLFDPEGGQLQGLWGTRPNWAPGATRESATTNVPPGYYFNPSAFALATVQPGQPIPSANDPTAIAGDTSTDVGNVGRNVLRGPGQSNVDFSVLKRLPIHESKTLDFRVDFFNLFNHANRNNPISDIRAPVPGNEDATDPNTGRILLLGDFGRILGFSSSPRILQFSLKFNF